jgi:hypothetical protein
VPAAYVCWARSFNSKSKLKFVRAFLSCLEETELLQMAHNLVRFKNGQAAHCLCDSYLLSADKLSLEMWFAVVEQHRHNLLEILI